MTWVLSDCVLMPAGDDDSIKCPIPVNELPTEPADFLELKEDL